MLTLLRAFFRAISLPIFLILLLGGIYQLNAQSTSSAQSADPNALEPVYHDFKGVQLGMSENEVRRKLGHPKESDETQDFFVLSDKQRVRVYYDSSHKATAIITTYIGKDSNAPMPKEILGADVEAKTDGSMYKLVQYPKAGYWVAYSRIGGDEPMTIITMQKMNGQ